MNIIEATQQSLDTEHWIRRTSNPHLVMKPTNTRDCYYIYILGSIDQPCRCWNPNAEDILACDYELYPKPTELQGSENPCL